jgi:uncharacterized repeat protein (TIGR01451 family)
MRWLAAALALLLLVVVLQLRLLVYAFYVLTALFLVSRWLSRRWGANVSATRECNREVAEIGDSVAVVVNLKNTGRLPIPWVLAEDLLPRGPLIQRPPRLKVSGRRIGVAMLAAGGQKTMYYQLHFEMRGYYQLGPTVLETGDLFGLHRRFTINARPSYVLVYPRVVPLLGYDIASKRPIGEVRFSYRLFEDPTRISGVRQYQDGDPMSRIHWRATARTGKLHCKTYEPSTIAGACMLLSFHRDGYLPGNEPVASELAITTAASLANALFELGQQIGLVTNGRDAADRVREEGWEHDYRTRSAAQESAAMTQKNDRLRPVIVETGRGPEQLTRILETLARLEFTDGLAMHELIMESRSRLPRDATVLAILSHVDAYTAAALGGLARNGYAVAAVLVTLDENLHFDSASRLLAEGIVPRRVRSEEELAQLCSTGLMR